ncbi:MAG: hypothetical protein NTU58_01640 [Candidatus Nealsonbacteria bacterium]|nr:hypothetical protein [Candidatus Nealsonbacteria bacterium]
MKKEFIKQFIKDAITSFVYWTVVLTPYMIFIVKIDFKQYIAWISMQAILLPPLGAVFSIIVRKLKKQ